jgi:hypothetical protein
LGLTPDFGFGFLNTIEIPMIYVYRARPGNIEGYLLSLTL